MLTMSAACLPLYVRNESNWFTRAAPIRLATLRARPPARQLWGYLLFVEVLRIDGVDEIPKLPNDFLRIIPALGGDNAHFV